MNNDKLIKLTAEQYELRIRSLVDHIKMMVNTEAYAGQESASVAADIRQRLKDVLRDSHTAVETLSEYATEAPARATIDPAVIQRLQYAHQHLADAMAHNDVGWSRSTDNCISKAQADILKATSLLK